MLKYSNPFYTPYEPILHNYSQCSIDVYHRFWNAIAGVLVHPSIDHALLSLSYGLGSLPLFSMLFRYYLQQFLYHTLGYPCPPCMFSRAVIIVLVVLAYWLYS